MIRPNIIKYAVLIFTALTVSACSSFGYYMDLMAGHSELLEQRKSVSELIEDKETTSKLRKLLKTSQNIRDFASKELDLPENNSYRMYADLKRRYAVWNVVAANEFSVEPKKWCFLFVGCLSYRGYFSKEDATNYANELKSEGFDTYVAGANAYSTLGWFDDPLLNTMLYKSEARRAGIIFHELAHQVVYIDDDSAFNEAFATAVEEEGIKRWMQKRGDIAAYEGYLVDKMRDSQLNQLLRQTRNKLKDLYKKQYDDTVKRREKKQIFKGMRNQYFKLKTSWADYSIYDKWMSQELNNSHLLLISTYHDLVPIFRSMLKDKNYDLTQFYLAVEQFGMLDKVKRSLKVEKVRNAMLARE